MSIQLATALWWLGAHLLSPPELGGQRVPDGDQDINWLLDAPWAKVALLITVAVGVMILTNSVMRKKRGRSGIRRKPDFNLHVAKLEQLPISTIAAAKAGAVHLVGTLQKGDGALGTGAHACVYQNRAKSARATAIAAEMILLADDTGVVGLEQLEAARVIAPREDHGPHDTIGLYLGDRVEVVGELMIFEQPQTVGGQALRGILGGLGQIQVRVLDRPVHAEQTKTAEPASDSDDPQPDSPTP